MTTGSNAARELQDLTIDTIETALTYINPNKPRAEWARIGMALKHELGDAGFAVFDNWSRGGDSYDEKSARETWKSIHASGTRGSVTINTVIYEAQQAGFDLKEATRKTLTADEIAARRKQREEDHAREEAERKRRQGEAAKMANLIIQEATKSDGNHPYLETKGVGAHNLYSGKWPVFDKDTGEVKRWLPNTLLVPIIDAKNGKTISLQALVVDHEGRASKFYLKDARKRGGYFMIGPVPEPGQVLAFCEGYATGATIHELTGWTVIVCFDAPNLPVVAALMREAFPQAAFIICADNDKWSATGDIENPGIHYAEKAAKATHAHVIIPQFADDSTRPTDFNDLASLEGADVATAQLMDNPITKRADALALPAPANDNTPQVDQPRAVDFYTPLPDVNGKGKPLATIENVQEVCGRLGVTVRYNVITKEEELLIPRESFSIDNKANASLAWLESWCARFSMPTDKLGGFITYLADQNLYNPVATWITSKPWDGTPRLQQLYETVVPVEDKRLPDGRMLRDVLIMRWMMSALAAAFNPDGVSAGGLLVLQGPQYLGKTMWLKQMAPPQLGAVQDGMILRPDDRDSVKQVCSFWLVELGELDATFRKSDIAALKSFITRKQDVLRRAYARKESTFARRTVFFGSVNPREYLHDPTGNRRYWTIECQGLDLEAQRKLDMQQVWAEAYELFKNGEGHHLKPDEMAALNNHNEQFMAIDPVEERLQTRLNWEAAPTRWEWKTATEILLKVGVDRPNQADATKCANIMRKMNGGQAKRSNGKSQLLCPPGVKEDAEDRPF